MYGPVYVCARDHAPVGVVAGWVGVGGGGVH